MTEELFMDSRARIASRLRLNAMFAERAVAAIAVLCMVVVVTTMAGCAGPGPQLFPAKPVRVEQSAGAVTLQWFDTDRDGEADYGEELGANGRVVALHYLSEGHNATIDLRRMPTARKRDLVLILDSIPYGMVQQAWDRGELRLFPRPVRTIPPFPVMTDPCLIDFFHLTPGVAIESDYYDGKSETDGYGLYLNGGVAGWEKKVDYSMSHLAHGSAYLDQLPWFEHELRQIQDGFFASDKKTYIGYSVGTSALGALQGAKGHALALSLVDRFCHEMMYKARGRLRITMLSDHGHSYYRSERIPLADSLRKMGYRVTTRLSGPRDIIVPEFAMVSCAAIYTHDPAPVARDALKVDGIELSAYPEPDGSLVVLSRDGQARIRRSALGYRYEPASGDPLKLVPIWNKLKGRGELDARGFAQDGTLFAATENHVYPDVVDRLWRAFHVQFKYKPDVLLSVAEGRHCGSAFQSRTVQLEAVHGNLRQASSSGFAITTAGTLPGPMRIRDLSVALERLGVDVLGGSAAALASH